MFYLHHDNGKFARIYADTADEKSLEQLSDALVHPAVRYVAAMPDIHAGFGVPIGSVILTKNEYLISAVGVDIGCGVAAYCTRHNLIEIPDLKAFAKSWYGQVSRDVPTGFHIHADTSHSDITEANLPLCYEDLQPTKSCATILEMMQRQQGTLGGGNHHLELTHDENGQIWILLHSGSRNVGLKVANYYDKLAKQLNEQWFSAVTSKIYFLPADSVLGSRYGADMQACLSYAYTNRVFMARKAVSALGDTFDKSKLLNIHHNYAAREHHLGSDYIVHRKGAIRLRNGEMGIIPASMGAPSYIVKGKGCDESYSSASHGAGRAMGRKEAERTFSQADFHEQIKHTYTTASPKLLDECPSAYKDIERVIAIQQEAGILEPVVKLSPIITLKGEGE
jgi:tRNA-splicing ligase RtcB